MLMLKKDEVELCQNRTLLITSLRQKFCLNFNNESSREQVLYIKRIQIFHKTVVF